MSDGYDYSRHGSDFPNCSDAEIELLCQLLQDDDTLWSATRPRGQRDAFSSLFLKARNAAAQRKIGPYGG